MLLTLLLAPLRASGQTFSSIDFPTDLCAGADTVVSFGYSSAFNIVIDTGHATQSFSDRAFLPDGIPCGTMGCSYQSVITFGDFAPGATITSAQDIKYVRVNMEHSFIGDIYIGLICPNGTHAALMNWSGSGSAECRSSVPTGHRSWTSGSYATGFNTYGSTFIGEAYDNADANHKCDSTRPDNHPGNGWNYCWSSNTTSGYTYKPGDALLYRSANTIQHYNTLEHTTCTTVDSSNVAAGTGFYHPQDNFATLEGCPLNGQWTIEVIDAYSQDNGYVFEWELALDPSLIPNPCPLTDKLILSGYSERIDDTTFAIHVPDDLAADTTVAFTLMMVNACGDTIDTTLSVRLHTPVVAQDYDTACDSYTYGGQTYNESDTIHVHGLSRYGCDSLTVLNLTIHYSHDTTLFDTIVENDLPYVVYGHAITPQVDHTTIDILDATTTEGCDSTIHVLLTVGFNAFDTIRDTVCRHALPYTFDNQSLNPTSDDMMLSLLYHTWLGADSTVTLMLHILHDDTVAMTDTIVANLLPYTMGSETFATSTDIDIVYTNSQGCDSTVHYLLHVWPNQSTIIDSSVCRHVLPVMFNGIAVAPTDVDTALAVTMTDMHGADSTVTLALTVLPDYELAVADTAVENQLPWTACGHPFMAPADTTFLFSTIDGCDSTVHYRLHVWYNDSSTVDTTLCRHQLPLRFNGQRISPVGNDTVFFVSTTTVHGADSTIRVSLHVNPDSHTEVSDTVVQNQLPVVYNGTSFSRPSDTTFLFANHWSCDSTVHYRLHVWSNIATSFDTGICANHFPIYWLGATFDEADTVVLHLHTTHGADSTVTLRMQAYPIYDIDIAAEICDNQHYTVGTQRITEAGHHSVMLTTIHRCDSLVNLDLTVWPTYSQYFTDTVCATSGIDFDGVHYMQSGTYTHNHPTVHGCDSLLTLNLNLRGLNLRAKAQIVPLIPTPENLQVEMRDVSRAAVDRLWTVGDMTSNEKNISYLYPENEDSVEVVLIAYSHDECADTTVTIVRIDRSTLFAPNAFTPGRDDNNHWQLFGMQVPQLEVWIYNRQGLLVAHYTGIEGSWDGTDLNGRPCQQGAYVYKVEYSTLLHPDRQQTMSGTILLIR